MSLIDRNNFLCLQFVVSYFINNEYIKPAARIYVSIKYSKTYKEAESRNVQIKFYKLFLKILNVYEEKNSMLRKIFI